MKQVNEERRRKAPGRKLANCSWDDTQVRGNPAMGAGLSLLPRPGWPCTWSTAAKIYQVYLKYVAPEDIHVYSIDEVLMDVTGYLNTYGLNARGAGLPDDFGHPAHRGHHRRRRAWAPTCTCAKVAMDIGAKHAQPDEHGVRIAELDEMSYRRTAVDPPAHHRFLAGGGGLPPKSWNSTAWSPWGTWPGAPWESQGSC